MRALKVHYMGCECIDCQMLARDDLMLGLESDFINSYQNFLSCFVDVNILASLTTVLRTFYFLACISCTLWTMSSNKNNTKKK